MNLEINNHLKTTLNQAVTPTEYILGDSPENQELTTKSTEVISEQTKLSTNNIIADSWNDSTENNSNTDNCWDDFDFDKQKNSKEIKDNNTEIKEYIPKTHLSKEDLEIVNSVFDTLGYKENDLIRIRGFDEKGKTVTITNPYPLKQLNLKPLTAYYFVPNSYGQKSDIPQGEHLKKYGYKQEHILTGRTHYMEFDNLTYQQQLTIIDKLKLPKPTLAIHTGGKSIHFYWVLKDPTPAKQWRALQDKLMDYSKSDTSLRDICQLLRLPQCPYVKKGTYSGKETTILHDLCDRSLRYTPEDLDKVIPITPKLDRTSSYNNQKAPVTNNSHKVPDLVVLLHKLGLNLPTNPYLAKALEKEYLKVANLTDDRNNYLNTASYNLGQLVNQGLNQDLIEMVMLQASHINGKVADTGISNVESTIKSGLNSGIADPRSDRPQSNKELKNQYTEYTKAENILNEIVTRYDKTLYYSSLSQSWYYYGTNNHFSIITETMVKKMIDSTYSEKSLEWCNLTGYSPFSHQINATKSKDIYYLMTIKLSLSKEQEENREKQRLELYKNYLPLKNGILNLTTKELLPHNSEFLNNYILNYDYIPDAQCETVLRFLNEGVSRKGDLLILKACVRAILTSRYDLEFFLEIIGKKGSGKSTFTGLVTDLVGQTNCYNTSIEDLEDKFTFDEYHDKKLVVISEATQFHKRPNNLLKITGKEALNINKKLQKGGGSKLYEGCVLVNGNERVRASDRAKALERRRRHIDFNNVPNTPDIYLADKLRAEISGFLNYLLEMTTEEMEKIIAKPESYSEGYRERMIEDDLNEDPLTSYLNEWLVISPDSKLSTEKLWIDFITKMEKLRIQTKFTNHCKLGEAIRGILDDKKIHYTPCKIKINNSEKRGLKGLRIKDEGEEQPTLFSGEQTGEKIVITPENAPW
ncbi:hypothetical protein GM3708_2041 [Geminocystis sp. NIES-3708]|uniref:DUF5906 domain-containing protein n=1 Tax=Geminocystis sp. NIES-3708 TaxID=1615909 RepID=UPI0005FC5276|nr:DUF5906 domain-containing protein [Geminocystis sp. NIES-3708]BAQ61635.1 hypothetical protein GM3708_2041 [Geminocystis sp. NIES-3708]